MSDAKYTYLAYIPEVTFGVTPATPTLTKIRYTKADIAAKNTLQATTQVRGDRMIGNKVKTFQEVAGGFDFEFSSQDFDAFLAAAVGGTWSTNVLVNGTTLESFAIEKCLIPSASYEVYNGCVVDSMTLKLSAKKIVTGTVKFIGNTTASASTAGGTVYTAAGTGSPIAASGSVTLTEYAGTTPLAIKDFELTIAAGVRGLDIITNTYGVDSMALSDCTVTGKVQVYFKTKALLDLTLASATTSLQLSFTDGTHAYAVVIPAAVLEKPDVNIDGVNTDLMISLDFSAQAGSIGGTPCNIQITRT